MRVNVVADVHDHRAAKQSDQVRPLGPLHHVLTVNQKRLLQLKGKRGTEQ